MTVRAISYGGGVQSTALVVLAAQGVIDFDLALFSNVGDNAEHPATLTYVRDVAAPWAAEHGVEVVEAKWTDRAGKVRDLYDDITREGNPSIDIPVFMAGGAPGRRKCTDRYKITVVGRELRKRGASPDTPATVAVGISTDEIQRVNSRKAQKWETPVYPLIDLGYDREACKRIIADAGLPVPPKSACWFCPMKRVSQWAEMRRDDPDMFERAAQLEDRLNENRAALERDDVYLSATARPLRHLNEATQSLFPTVGDGCDEGYCWT